jgi:uncharacterized protein
MTMKSIFLGADARLRNGWKALIFVVITAACIFALMQLAKFLPAGAKVFGNLVPVFAALIASWICVRAEKDSLASLGLRVNAHFLGQLGAGLAAGAGLLLLTGAGVWALDGFHLQNASADPAILVKGGFVMLCVGIFEETLFHGYAFQRAVRGMGPFKAQILFALIFCAAHAGNPGMHGMTIVLAMSNIFLAGLMLGYCYLRTGSLALPIGLHMGWNWTQEMLGFGVSGGTSHGLWTPVFHQRPEWLTGGSFGLEASAVGVVVLALAVAALASWKGNAGAAGAQAQSGQAIAA